MSIIDNGPCPTCGGPCEKSASGDWYHFLEEDAETCENREYGGRG